MPPPRDEGFCFAGCLVLRDSSSGVERLLIPSGWESESAAVLVVCSTCDLDITSKSCKKYLQVIDTDGSRSRRPRCEASMGSC
ncbi:hypothetical protein CDL15_Pgr004504 [Punica granatum]|uniref:Uncharacterized protein n=1 Tax=Punica granatum TaxID=22663 RepID=A0A218WZL9_PUNGR|nr:hypothetical protein CDL15_Pgr004504 [Punica granatum]